jgi:septum formation inhibitor MinC
LGCFLSGRGNNTKQAELLRMQNNFQDLSQQVNLLDQDFKRQQEIINTGAQVAQKIGPPILREMGYLAAKNKNEKLKNLLVRQKLEPFTFNEEQLKKEEEARRKPEAVEEPKKKPERPAPASAPTSGPTPGASPSLRP